MAAKAPRIYPTWSAGLSVKAWDRLYYPATDRLYKTVIQLKAYSSKNNLAVDSLFLAGRWKYT